MKYFSFNADFFFLQVLGIYSPQPRPIPIYGPHGFRERTTFYGYQYLAISGLLPGCR